jgi:glycosyltransferase involved in cell wall biosynthesis
VTDEVPETSLGGGSIRQYHLLRRVAGVAEVDLLLVGRLEDRALRDSLHQVIELDRPPARSARYSGIRNRLSLLPGLLPTEVALASPVMRALRPRLANTGDYDAVQIEHEWLAPLANGRKAGCWVITLHNLLSVRLRQAAALGAKRRVNWLLERDATHAERLEASVLGNYDQVISVSEEDAAQLGGGVAIVPNGVDLQQFRVSELPDQPRLIFTGSWNWKPNAEAAVWACTVLLPLVKARLPDVTLTLVGREPPAQVRELSDLAGVETYFDVPSVVPHLERARIALVPLWVGSGTRLKALEAMAAGRPVVGTSTGLEGLGVVDRCTGRIADSAVEMADRVVELCQDDDRAGAMASAARKHVEKSFGWDAIAEGYLDVLREAAESRGS